MLDQTAQPSNIPWALPLEGLKSYHIQDGVQSCENNTGVVKTSVKGPKHREDTHTHTHTVEWSRVLKWAERPNSGIAVELSQVLWSQLPQADKTPKTQTVFLVETTLKNLHPQHDTDSGWWWGGIWSTCLCMCFCLTCADACLNP